MADDEREQIRARMAAAVHRAVERLGAQGVRRASGTSLVAVLCASALAPIAVAGVALGPVALAAVGVVGALGAGKLTEVVDSALEALRRSGDGDGGEVSEEAVERELVERLERTLSGADESAAAVREAAAELLRGLDVVHGEVAEGLMGLSVQFAEFAFVAEDIRAGVFAIERSLRQQSAESQRARVELFRLARAVESAQAGDASALGGAAGGDGSWVGCPYLGLVAYGPGDARVFFGRAQLTFDLQHKLLVERLGADGPLVVTGPSGAGKSSLLQAGLLPALARGEVLPETRTWPCRVITPTTHPLQELSALLADVSGQSARAVYELLSLNPQRAARLVAEALARRGGAGTRHGTESPQRLVLVVDQFEELFTHVAADAEGRAEREAFLAALEALAGTDPAQAGGGPAPGLVVAAVRGDFLDQAMDILSLAGAREAGLFRVGSMTAAQLAEAITGPAAEAGLGVEPELVEELLREVRERPDALALGSGVLPLVSQVMARVWEQREDERLTVRGYRRVGGLAEAVNRDAAEAYGQLSPAEQQTARAVFLRLTLVSGEGRAARRRAGRKELYQAAGDRQEEVDRLIEVFAARRLLVLEDDRVEISHETLLQAWGMLQGWLDEDRANHVVYGRLSADAESWQQHDEDAAYLYSGRRLREIATVQAGWEADPERSPKPAPAVTRFLDAGRAAEKTRVSRRRRTLIGLTALAVAATGAAIGAAVAAESARRDNAAARVETAVAASQRLAADALSQDATEPYTARQLAAAAWAASPTPEARQAAVTLLNEQTGMLVTPDGQLTSAVFNPAGTALATVGKDGIVRLWDLATWQQIGAPIKPYVPLHSGLGNGINGAVFNPAGTVLAVIDDGIVSLWNPATRQRIGPPIAGPEQFGNAVNSVAFNPAGTVLATADGGIVDLWNPATEQQIGTAIAADDTSVNDIAFNSTGTVLATADGDGTVRLWNPATGQQIGTAFNMSQFGTTITDVEFNPAGTILAVADSEGTVRLWNPATEQLIGNAATADDTSVNDIAFNSAGTVLAVADGDGTVRLLDPATDQQIGTTISVTGSSDLAGNIVNGVAFNPAGTVLALADGDGTVRLWNPATQQQIGTAVVDGGSAICVALDPAGTILAIADSDGTVRLWNPVVREQVGADIVDGTTVLSVAFNPAGTILATADRNGNVRLWSVATQQQIGTTFTSSINGNPVGDIMFNPAGTILATAGNDGTVGLWSVATHRRTGTITVSSRPGGAVTAAAFDSDGTILATADSYGTVDFWNPATQRRIGNPIATGAGFNTGIDIAFNRAGTILAVAYSDNTIDLWNPANHQRIATITATTGANGVAFNSDGTILATADSDGTVDLWNPATQRQIGSAVTIAGDGSSITSVMFNSAGTTLATTDYSGAVDLTNVSWQVDSGPLLCQEFGLPSRATWSRLVGTSLPEPADCP